MAGRIIRCPACKNVSPVPRPVEHTPEATIVKEEPIQLVDSDAGENGLTAVGITEWPKCMPRTAERMPQHVAPDNQSRFEPVFFLIVGIICGIWMALVFVGVI